jgi:hypothetical protein
MSLATVTAVPDADPDAARGSRRTTPLRTTQIADGPWVRFGEVATKLGTNRAALMRTLVLWFIRWPGVKLPPRPAPPVTRPPS